MKIRSDLHGCVIVGPHILFPGDSVPDGVTVGASLLDGTPHATVETVPHVEVKRPGRADNKAAWFAFAQQEGVVEDGATMQDYSKADLIELVG